MLYAIGDIHGEHGKLIKLLRKLRVKDSDTLIFLGDYVDRGPDSFEVIEELIKLNKNYRCVFIRGNHDGLFLDYLGGLYSKSFLEVGGKATTMSYLEKGYRIGLGEAPVEHVDFLLNTVYYHKETEFVFTHAGLPFFVHEDIKLDELDNNHYERFSWGIDFLNRTYEGKTMVCGHYVRPFVTNTKYKICVDTGAGFNKLGLGRLTCIRLPDRAIFDTI